MKPIIITAITIATILTAIIATSAQTQIRVGKDKEGVEWFTFAGTVRKVVGERYVTGIHTAPKAKGTSLVVYIEVDCSDFTARLVGYTVYTNGKKTNSSDSKTDWGTPQGLIRTMYYRMCPSNDSM
jgi:hypothetical protein